MLNNYLPQRHEGIKIIKQVLLLSGVCVLVAIFFATKARRDEVFFMCFRNLFSHEGTKFFMF
jgi:hypothetical protein